jgi:hypothetical protein
MNIRSKLALVIGVVVLLCVAGWTSRAENPSKTDWEYKMVTIRHHPNVPQQNLKQFNDLGDEGWELVTVNTENDPIGNVPQTKLTCYFKRPR